VTARAPGDSTRNGGRSRRDQRPYRTALLALNQPIEGMAVTPSGDGYWMVASDGGIFSFGDADFYGSEGGRVIDSPVVGLAATGDGGGYWETTRDGSVYAFGDATGGDPNQIDLGGLLTTGIVSTPTGYGYWLVDLSGGIHPFGDAQLFPPG
jgi:hypothetical protein